MDCTRKALLAELSVYQTYSDLSEESAQAYSWTAPVSPLPVGIFWPRTSAVNYQAAAQRSADLANLLVKM